MGRLLSGLKKSGHGSVRNDNFGFKVVVFFLFIVSVLNSAAEGQVWSGSGTEQEPYLIYDANDMQAIGADANFWDAHFKLMADVDLGGYTGASFNIIGVYADGSGEAFTGVFDGNGHEILNFTYESDEEDYVGLFGYINEARAEIKDLVLVDPNISGGTGAGVGSVGSVAGYLYHGTVIGCSVDDGSIEGDNIVGGLIGEVVYGIITECRVEGCIVSGSEGVGGVVGYYRFSSFCGVISHCYTTGEVNGILNVGGLVGINKGDIHECYSQASALGDDGVGGLVGWNGYYGRVFDCYSSGAVTGSGDDIGGLVGRNDSASAVIEDCFWDVQSSGQTESASGTGLPTSKMQDMSSFIGAGWDFVGEVVNGESDIWGEPEGGGYPVLWFELSDSGPLPPFSGGAGTSEEPYLISTAGDLNNIGCNPRLMGKYFSLTGDVDLTGWDVRLIGSRICPFRGVFEGCGHNISNFNCSYGETIRHVGLFSYIGSGGLVENLDVIDVNIDAGTEGSYVGGVVGSNYGGEIRNCHVAGNISGDLEVGGVSGGNWGVISGSCFAGSVLGREQVAGMLGVNYGLVINCFSEGTVSAYMDIGGLVGSNYKGAIRNSFSRSDVFGEMYWVGGLLGHNDYGVVSNCYSRGDVLADGFVGGLLGLNREGWILNCYGASDVNGTGYTGGLVGQDIAGGYTACFWDRDINPDLSGIGNAVEPNVVGESTVNMQMLSTYTLAGWDFVGESANGAEDIWRLCEDGVDYPRLSWEFCAGDFVCPDGVTMLDFSVFAGAWLSEQGEAAWDGGCDISEPCDGVIDGQDLAVFVENWLSGV